MSFITSPSVCPVGSKYFYCPEFDLSDFESASNVQNNISNITGNGSASDWTLVRHKSLSAISRIWQGRLTNFNASFLNNAIFTLDWSSDGNSIIECNIEYVGNTGRLALKMGPTTYYTDYLDGVNNNLNEVQWTVHTENGLPVRVDVKLDNGSAQIALGKDDDLSAFTAANIWAFSVIGRPSSSGNETILYEWHQVGEDENNTCEGYPEMAPAVDTFGFTDPNNINNPLNMGLLSTWGYDYFSVVNELLEPKRYTAQNYARLLKDLLPRGILWVFKLFADGAAGSNNWSKFLHALAQELNRIDDFVLLAVNNSLPSNAVEMLSEWEEVLGLPDKCSTLGASITQRQRDAGIKFIGNTFGVIVNPNTQVEEKYKLNIRYYLEFLEAIGSEDTAHIVLNASGDFFTIGLTRLQGVNSRLGGNLNSFYGKLIIDPRDSNADYIKCVFPEIYPAHCFLEITDSFLIKTTGIESGETFGSPTVNLS